HKDNKPADADLAAEMQRYRDDCRRRWVAAHQAGRRKELEEQLRIRRQLEQTATDALERARTADENLRAASARCGMKARDLPDTAAALQTWLEQGGKDRQKLHQDLQKWRALQSTRAGVAIREVGRRHA